MKTCRRGHEYPANRIQCPICQAAATKRSHQAKREQRSRESVLYFQKHKDKKAANNKLYWDRHPEKVKQHQNKFREDHPLASIWGGMIHRCGNKNNPHYHSYGGRGITVCDEWKGPGGLARFELDMSPRPSRHHTLDRIDNDKGYSKENCQWATRTEQGRNRRACRMITLEGRTQTIGEWAQELRMSPTGFANRIKRGWTEDRLLDATCKKKQGTLGRKRRIELALLDLYETLGDSEYGGRDNARELLIEVGLIPVEQSQGSAA